MYTCMLVFRDPSSSFLVSSNVTNAVIAISFTSPGKNFSKPLAPSKLSSERCFKLGGKRCYAAALKRPIYTRRFFLIYDCHSGGCDFLDAAQFLFVIRRYVLQNDLCTLVG